MVLKDVKEGQIFKIVNAGYGARGADGKIARLKQKCDNKRGFHIRGRFKDWCNESNSYGVDVKILSEIPEGKEEYWCISKNATIILI